MDKIYRKISLENIKSRCRGLLPYMTTEKGDLDVHEYTEDKNRGNWGNIPLSFYSSDNLGINPSYYKSIANENGTIDTVGVYDYSELYLRYVKARKIITERIPIKPVVKNQKHMWMRAGDKLSRLVDDDEMHNVLFTTFKNVEEVNKVLDERGYIFIPGDVAETLWERGHRIFLVNSKILFDNWGGTRLFRLMEDLTGRFEMLPKLVNESVPEYIQISQIVPLYNWLIKYRNAYEKETRAYWNALGGNEMISYLKSSEYRKDGVKPIELESHVLGMIERMSFIKPNFSININLKRDFYDNGVMTPYIPDEGEESGNVGQTDSDISRGSIAGKGESLLPVVMNRFVSYDDDGNALPGMLKEWSRDFNGTNMSYVIFKKNGKIFARYLKSDSLIDPEMISIPTASCLSDVWEDIENKIPVRIKYENYREYIPREPVEEDFVLINEDGSKRWKVNGTMYIPEEWNGNRFPTDTQKIYYLKKKVFDDENVLAFNSFIYIKYDSGHWHEKKEPAIKIYSSSGTSNIIRVKEVLTKNPNATIDTNIPERETKERFFAQCGSPGLIFHNNRVFKSGKTSNSLPFIENKPYDVVPVKKNEADGTYEGYGNWVSSVQPTDGHGFFDIEYYIGASFIFTIGEDGEYEMVDYPLMNEDGKLKTGMKYKETIPYDYAKSVKCKLDGYMNEVYFDSPRYEDTMHTSKIPDREIYRKVRVSDIEYPSMDYIYKKNKSGEQIDFPEFKEEFMSGVMFNETPVVNGTINRGNAAAFEKRYKMMECNTMDDLRNYGNNYFNLD